MENEIKSGNPVNFYGVAYGKVTKRVKEQPAGYVEVTEAELKSAAQNFERLPIKNRYITKDLTAAYPFQIFLDSLTGKMVGFEKFELNIAGKKSFVLKIILQSEKDGVIHKGELSIDFYSRYTEGFLNCFCSVTDLFNVTIRPYQFESKELYKERKYYQTGVSIYEHMEDKPVGKAYALDDLPPTEPITDAKGQTVYSRVNRINFLYEQAVKHLGELKNALGKAAETAKPEPEKPKPSTSVRAETTEETIDRMFAGKDTAVQKTASTHFSEDDDLPF